MSRATRADVDSRAQLNSNILREQSVFSPGNPALCAVTAAPAPPVRAANAVLFPRTERLDRSGSLLALVVSVPRMAMQPDAASNPSKTRRSVAGSRSALLSTMLVRQLRKNMKCYICLSPTADVTDQIAVNLSGSSLTPLSVIAFSQTVCCLTEMLMGRELDKCTIAGASATVHYVTVCSELCKYL